MRTTPTVGHVEKLYAGLRSAEFLYPLPENEDDDDNVVIYDDGIPYGEPAVKVTVRKIHLSRLNGPHICFEDSFDYVADASTIRGSETGSYPDPHMSENTQLKIDGEVPEEDGFFDAEMMIKVSTPVEVRILALQPHISIPEPVPM